jgi:hypothetical protein
MPSQHSAVGVEVVCEVGKTLKERQEAEARQRALYESTLKGTKKQLQQERDEKQQKKKPAEHLLPYLLYRELKPHQIRDMGDYRPRSYNLDKQIVDLINHLFVRYPVPYFLYQVCLNTETYKGARVDRFYYMHDIYREWFITIAQGGSFTKAVKGVMTSKEASLFLTGGPHRFVHENAWLAKMQVAEVPFGLHDLLIDRILTRHYFDDRGGRLMDMLRFYARYHGELDKDTLGEVTDFLAWKIDNDPSFSMKGRTAGSVVKLANEWHVLIQKAKLGIDIEWDGFNIPYWSVEIMETPGQQPTLWEVLELRNNRELMNEGRKQKHCVYGYVHRCVEGRCSIFSLRQYRLGIVGVDDEGNAIKQKFDELTRVTVEVASDRSILQTKGALNRMPTTEEASALNQWAGVNGFTYRFSRW